MSILSVLMQIQLGHSKSFLRFKALKPFREEAQNLALAAAVWGFLPRCVAALDIDVVSVLVRSIYIILFVETGMLCLTVAC